MFGVFSYSNGVWGILGVIAAIWVIYDVVIKQKKMKDVEKIIWMVLAVLTHLVAAIIYFFLYKFKKK